MDIIVGFTRTAEGRAALDRAIDEARLRDGRLVVVHSSTGGHEDVDEVIALREELDTVDARLAAENIDHEIHELVRGNTPAEDLVGMAADKGAGLIVIGLRRRSPVGKLLLGSNAQDVLLSAECPVLAVKPPQH